MHLARLVAFAIVLTGCSNAPQRNDSSPPPPPSQSSAPTSGTQAVPPAQGSFEEAYPLAAEWQRTVTSLPRDAHEAADALNRQFASSGIPLSYWAPEDSAESWLQSPPPGVEIFEPACGLAASVRSPVIPPTNGLFQAEKAIEVDTVGTTVRTWSLPKDLIPIGLRGEELIVPFYSRVRTDLAIAVLPNGRYRVVPQGDLPDPVMVECPIAKLFGESVYTQCAELAESGRGRRIIAYQTPCT